MGLSDVGMVAGDTARSRVYLQAMAQEGLLPDRVLLMVPEEETALPGQKHTEASRVKTIGQWEIDLALPAETLLDSTSTPYQSVRSTDINSDAVIKGVQSLGPTTLIYSGFGGGILRRRILHLGKQFLHVHGGYLPDYKGSTTVYYSLLTEGTCGASSIFLSEEIDGGPVLVRRVFDPPFDRTQIDYFYDSVFRAKVLIETLSGYAASKRWDVTHQDPSQGETFYIIHPLLKHIAILGQKGKTSCE